VTCACRCRVRAPTPFVRWPRRAARRVRDGPDVPSQPFGADVGGPTGRPWTQGAPSGACWSGGDLARRTRRSAWAAQTHERALGALLERPAWKGRWCGACGIGARLTAAQAVRSVGSQPRRHPSGRRAHVARFRCSPERWAVRDGSRPRWRRPQPSPALRAAELAVLDVPTGIAALVDDPVHTLAVARRWREIVPRQRSSRRDGGFRRRSRDDGRAALIAWLPALRDGDATRPGRR